ncbi:hypothetical protein [Lysinibacillus fusiformis]|uniref:hypothetical protein n=1 Tax=Lysinibacillus fusiformis TaxID=28031 RepID=UPI0004682DD0|nr:hypothetical protein [Lysinibacillus fusiformis]
MYLKVEGTGGGSSGSGIGRIEVYDLNGQLVPLTKTNVMATNANQRIGADNYLYLFQQGSVSNPPPYNGIPAGIHYIIKLPVELSGFSKIYLMNWGNGSYNVANISISISENNHDYEQIYSGSFLVSESREILHDYIFSLDSILLRSHNKIYSLCFNELIEISNLSMDTFQKYGNVPCQNLDIIFSKKSYIPQGVEEVQLTQKPLKIEVK